MTSSTHWPELPPQQVPASQVPAQRHTNRLPSRSDLISKARFASVLTPGEVAWVFRVDPKTITRWCKAGKLSDDSFFRTLGGHRRFFETELDAILAQEISDPRRRKAMFDEAKRLSAQGRIKEPEESNE